MSKFKRANDYDKNEDLKVMANEIKLEIERLKSQLHTSDNFLNVSGSSKIQANNTSIISKHDDLMKVQERIQSLLSTQEKSDTYPHDLSPTSPRLSLNTAPNSARTQSDVTTTDDRNSESEFRYREQQNMQTSPSQSTDLRLHGTNIQSNSSKQLQYETHPDSSSTGSISSRSSDSESSSKSSIMEEDNTIDKYQELEGKLQILQDKYNQLEESNTEKERKNALKIQNLKKRNGELASIARRLETKAKALQEQVNKKPAQSSSSDKEIQAHKKTIAKLKARMDSELSKRLNEKDYQIKTLRSQVEDLKRGLRQANAIKHNQSIKSGEDDYLTNQSAKNLQMENMRLHKLAAAASNKVIVRSLSTPVTARQKILEGTNRNLRRQIVSLEEEIRELNNGSNNNDLKNKIEEYKTKNLVLQKSLEEAKINQVTLGSELQTAKVEASDLSIKLNDQMNCYQQLQGEYATIHDRLTNVITERDEARTMSTQHIEKIKQIENHISDLERRKGELEAKIPEHEQRAETNAKNYAESLKQLQEKVALLEQQYQEQALQNQLLVEKLKNTSGNEAKNNNNTQDGNVAGDTSETFAPLIMDRNCESKLRVYISKYTYNPYEGPNENPESELPLVAGDYVYVFGEMDEDGFYTGELMDGRRGLVPSNFIEPVHEGSQFNRLYKGHSPDIKSSDNSYSELSTSQSELLIGKSVTKSSSYVLTGVLPYPRKLKIDKKLSHSLIIGWLCPVLPANESVEEYHVFVNNVFQNKVIGSKTKAVVENIHHEKSYRIGVCAVTALGISDMNLCVISHGKSSDNNPRAVRTEHLTSTGVRILWTPASSQLTHVVTVEEEYSDGFASNTLSETKESYVVPPPLYYHTLSKMRSNVSYKVTVSVRGDTSSSTHVRFTTPEAGPPDPPINVQIEEAVDFKNIKVTWLPVTLSTYGTSNGVSVCGYSVYIGDRKLTELNCATVDQCLIPTDVFAHAAYEFAVKNQDKTKPDKLWNVYKPPCVTMTTLATTSQISESSDPCIISFDFFKKLCNLIPNDIKEQSLSDSIQNRFISEARRSRPPFQHSMESTDLDVSLSSDHSGQFKISYDDNQQGSVKNSRPDWARRSAKAQTRINSLKATRVVPSIEITHETSSEEDMLKSDRSKGSHRSRNKAVATTYSKSTNAIYNEEVHSSQDSSSNPDSIPSNNRLKHNDVNGKDDAVKSASVANIIRPSSPSVLRNNQSYLSSAKERKYRETNGTHRSHSVSSNRSQESHKSRSSSHSSVGMVHGDRASRNQNIIRQSTYSSQSDQEYVRENTVRLFVALYDYDPDTMSPNTDAANEELSFVEGQLIKIFGDKDGDGFYNGETHHGTHGLVPCNLVSEVEVDSMQMLCDLHERGHLPSSSPDDEMSFEKDSPESSKQQTEEAMITNNNESNALKTRYFIAVFDYDPIKLSPNIDAEIEMGFHKDDVITIVGEMDEDGFFKGKCGAKSGLVPSNYLKEISEEEARKPQKSEPILQASTMDYSMSSAHANKPPKPYSSQPNSIAPSSVNNTVQRSYTSPAHSKRGGLLSKGKKFLKKLGSSSDLKHK